VLGVRRHPGLGRGVDATRALLLSKAERLMASGRSVGVASQLCFDAELMVSWLERTRRELGAIAARYPSVAPPTLHVGLYGPTRASRLQRIASICEVSSFFLDGAFEHVDTDHDGLVSEAELLAAAPELHADTETLHGLFELHANSDGKTLARHEFAEILADLGDEKAHQLDGTQQLPDVPGEVHSVAGPSTQVQQGGGGGGAAADEPLVWPEELVLALAAYAEREALKEGELVCHFYPFGGVAHGLQLLADLASGTWPHVEYR
jgi:hypothetical protein